MTNSIEHPTSTDAPNGNFSSNTSREGRCVERTNRSHGALAGRERFPEHVRPDPKGRDDPDAADDGPPHRLAPEPSVTMPISPSTPALRIKTRARRSAARKSSATAHARAGLAANDSPRAIEASSTGRPRSDSATKERSVSRAGGRGEDHGVDAGAVELLFGSSERVGNGLGLAGANGDMVHEPSAPLGATG